MNKHARTKKQNTRHNRQDTAVGRASLQPISQTVHSISASDSTFESNFEIMKVLPLKAEDALSNPNGQLNAYLGDVAVPAKISSDVAAELTHNIQSVALSFSYLNSKFSNHRPANLTEIDRILNQLAAETGIYLKEGTSEQRLGSFLQRIANCQIQIVDNGTLLPDVDTKNRCLDALHALLSILATSEQFSQSVRRSSERAIYEFAYGLSHEINNPLANIAARAQQLIASANSDADKRSLATIVDQAMRAHEMLSEMMRVVQPRRIDLRIDDVVSVVKEALDLQSNSLKHTQIHVDWKLASKPIYAALERASLSEAVLSLLQNAIQVCRPNDRIEVCCHEIVETGAGQGQVRIAICDTGPGLTPESIERAWDLFYSGREHGRGLGISLANVKQILDAHGGKVWIESATMAGCSVEIRLPRLPEPPATRRLPKV